MSDAITRGRKALKRIFQRNVEEDRIFATLGRHNADGSYTFIVPGRAQYRFVTLRQASGAQTVAVARDDAGVPHSPNLPIELRRENTTLIIVAIAKRSDLAYTSPGQDADIHTHDSRYFTEAEHIAVSAGAANAGDPVVLDVDGHLDVTMLNAADIATKMHAATLDTTPLDADEVPGLDSSASFGLLRWTWTTIKAFLKTYFDTLYVALAGTQTITGDKTFTGNFTKHTTGAATGGVVIITDGGRALAQLIGYRNSAAGPFIQTNAARGTEATPLANNNNDRIFEFASTDHDGTGFAQALAFFGLADGAPTVGSHPGRWELATTPSGAVVPITGLVIDAAQNVAIATVKGPSDVRFWLLQPALGSVVQRLQSTSTGDDPIQDTSQGRIATTGATPATLQTIPIPASHACQLEAVVTARRTGGASGTAEDCAAYVLRGLFKNVAGVATIVGAIVQTVVGESVAGYDATLVVSGGDVLVQVTGVATTNITWHSTTRHWFLSS